MNTHTHTHMRPTSADRSVIRSHFTNHLPYLTLASKAMFGLKFPPQTAPLYLLSPLISILYPLWHALLRHWVCGGQHMLARRVTWTPALPPRIKPFKEEATLIRVVACTTDNRLPPLRTRAG